MPDSLDDLLTNDQEAQAFFDSLPMFIQDQLREEGEDITTKEALSGLANMAMSSGLKLDQYMPMFEDETDSEIDLL